MAKSTKRQSRRRPCRQRRRTSSISSKSSGVSISTLDTEVSNTQSHPPSNDGADETTHGSKTYRRLKRGLQKSVPAAIVLWPFHKLRSEEGLTSRRIINFIKKHYRVIDNPRKTGKSIGTLLRCAVEFGLIEKRGNRYFLARSKNVEERRRK